MAENDPVLENSLSRALLGHRFVMIPGTGHNGLGTCINCGTYQTNAGKVMHCPPTLQDKSDVWKGYDNLTIPASIKNAWAWGEEWLHPGEWKAIEDYRESIGLPRKP